MADPSFQRSIDQAARTLAAANADWDRINTQMLQVPAIDREVGMPGKATYDALAQQLDAAAKRSGEAEKAYQSALELSDRAAATAKEFAPVGEKRQRLDTSAGNVLVAVTEVADGRGGWSNDPNTPPKKVDIPGVTGSATVTAAPSSEWILKNGVLEKNPAYKPPTPAAGGAVPTSEYVYDENGKPVKNVAYVPPKPDKPAAATVNTTAEYIPDPDDPTKFIKNPNRSAGTAASDAAVAETAQPLAAANLSTAQNNVLAAELAVKRATIDLANAPTSEEAKRAKETAQRGLDLANDGLAQAQGITAAEAPGRLKQQAATLGSTEASTQSTLEATRKNQQGDLYGLEDKIKQVRDLIASGEVKPQDGDNMIAAARQGTNVYDVMKQQASDASGARSQDIQSKNQMASTFGSTFNNSLTQFGELNKTGAIGSDATGKAFLATLGLAQDYLKSYEPAAATPTDYLGTGMGASQSPVGAMAGLAQQQLGAPPAIAPVVAPPVIPEPVAPVAQPITINVGSGAASNPQPNPTPPAVVPGPVPSPLAAGGLGPVMDPAMVSGNRLAGAASRGTPAGINDIAAMFPGAAKRHGLQW